MAKSWSGYTTAFQAVWSAEWAPMLLPWFHYLRGKDASASGVPFVILRGVFILCNLLGPVFSFLFHTHPISASPSLPLLPLLLSY